MSTSTETITWHHLPAAKLPDSDQTVLVGLSNDSEPSWIGYHDGEAWRQIDHASFSGQVVKWADMPGGEA
jgi:hypothetical protein